MNELGESRMNKPMLWLLRQCDAMPFVPFVTVWLSLGLLLLLALVAWGTGNWPR